MDRYVRLNRELWDEWTDINYRSEFYDVAGFIAHVPPLDEIVWAGLGELAGKSVLHLQCHFTHFRAGSKGVGVGVESERRVVNP